MLDINISTLRQIEQGIAPVVRVDITFKHRVESCTIENQKLAKDGFTSVRTGVSREGGYIIGNVHIKLLNTDYYWSRLFEQELPTDNLVVAYFEINNEDVEIFRGKVNTEWTVTPQIVTLPTLV